MDEPKYPTKAFFCAKCGTEADDPEVCSGCGDTMTPVEDSYV